MRTIVLIFVTILFTLIIYNVGRNSYQFEKDEYFRNQIPCPNFIIDGEGNNIEITDEEVQLLVKSYYVHLDKKDSLRLARAMYQP